jgi:ABC-type multidrug transport system fused ATPase/permease subunit
MYARNHRELVVQYLKPLWGKVTFLLLFLGCTIVLQIVNPQLLASFINIVTTTGVTSTVVLIAASFVGVALLQQVFVILTTYVGERVGWSATNHLRQDLTRHLIQLDMSFYKEHTPGKLIERVDGDITAMANFFSQFVILVVGNMILLVAVLVVLTVQCWQAGLALTLFTLLVLVLMLRIRNIGVTFWRSFSAASAELYGFLEERIGGTEDIRASGAIPYVMRRFYSYAHERTTTGRRARLISAPLWGTSFIARMMGMVLAFVLIYFLYRSHSISLGLAFLIYYYVGMVIDPINKLTEQLDQFQKASAGFVRVRELFKVESQINDGAGVTLGKGAGAVEFADVSFGYNEEAMVLKDLSFTIKPGEVLGLLGRTGSGKTTITRLLLRLYDPASGSISLNGYDLRDARLSELRSNIGMVTQNVQLFQASIRDNLTFFDNQVRDERILDALQTLGMLDWLHRLPDGLDTKLGANGGGLSAGEAQLLAFARVFLKDPALVILDEASSRLDPVTENLLEQAIDRLLEGRTAIIIAHRLSTVQRADTIMLLEQGEIREYGSRETLLRNRDSRFSQLLETAHEEVLA